MLIILAGLPGSGKSALAAELARLTGGVVLDKDDFRARIYEPHQIEYSPEQDDRVMELLLHVASLLLAREPDLRVFLDGRVFARNQQLRQCTSFAEAAGQPWRVIECVCAPETARARIAAQQGTHPAANRTVAFYDEIRARFEEIPQPKLVVETDWPLEENARRAIAFLG
jgi:predicted kinase